MQNKKVIGIVVIILVAGLSFWGGMMLAGKNIKAAATSRQNSFAQNGGARGDAGMRIGASGGLVSGQILSKDNTSITVQLNNGGSKIVFFSPTTKIEKTIDGSAVDAIIGKSVMINGTTNSDGSVSATSIQIRPTPTPIKTN